MHWCMSLCIHALMFVLHQQRSEASISTFQGEWQCCGLMAASESGRACSQFFLNGKTLPIERGQGLQQPAMQTAAQLLAHGDWVHLFPEGRVGFSGRLQPCKWGVGKLVCDAVVQSGRYSHNGRSPVSFSALSSASSPLKCTFVNVDVMDADSNALC